MKTIRSSRGPSGQRPYFTDSDFERICSEELRGQGLYPASPEPVRVERFIEKRFGITPVFEALPAAVLGYTEFGPTGPSAIYVSRALSEDGSRIADRRITSTLAHEAGHGLLHSHLFVLEPVQTANLFGNDADVSGSRILCRDEGRRGYDGRWWEVQANRAMACLMLPQDLVLRAIDELRVQRGLLGVPVLEDSTRRKAVSLLSETFDVSLQAAELRLNALVPRTGSQLSL